ncbi:DUF1003 domain-containing protein [bacterium]|nr:MAG: DUF1003 domain-containing protein [bacterium]
MSHSHSRNHQRTPYHGAKSVEELAQLNVEAIARMEEAARSERSRLDCIVDGITTFCGRIAFVYLHAALFACWIGFNTLMPREFRFDPYPFEFLTFSVSLEAIFLSAFILISQNRSSQLDERRNQLVLQIALLSEQENTKTLQMLDSIVRKVGATVEGDPEIEVLEAATRPEKLIEQIEAAKTKSHSSHV